MTVDLPKLRAELLKHDHGEAARRKTVVDQELREAPLMRHRLPVSIAGEVDGPVELYSSSSRIDECRANAADWTLPMMRASPN